MSIWSGITVDLAYQHRAKSKHQQGYQKPPECRITGVDILFEDHHETERVLARSPDAAQSLSIAGNLILMPWSASSPS